MEAVGIQPRFFSEAAMSSPICNESGSEHSAITKEHALVLVGICNREEVPGTQSRAQSPGTALRLGRQNIPIYFSGSDSRNSFSHND